MSSVRYTFNPLAGKFDAIAGPVPDAASTFPARVFTTAYQPNTDRPTHVGVTVDLPGGDGDTTDNIVLEVSADGSTGWTIHAEAQINFDVSGLGVSGQANARQQLAAFVIAGYYYRIRRVSGTGTILRTVETTL